MVGERCVNRYYIFHPTDYGGGGEKFVCLSHSILRAGKWSCVLYFILKAGERSCVIVIFYS